VVVGPVFHVYVEAPLPMSTTLCPLQIAAEAEVAATVGYEFTVTEVVLVLTQPEVVPVTV
jgi:hypothetical protein